jgi:nucleotide-binding universal stress UspA family protein
MGDLIVVGTDGSETAKLAVQEAVRLANALDAEVHVVSAFEPLRGVRIAGAPEGAAEVGAPLPDAQVEATLSETAAAIRIAHTNLSVITHAVQHDPADAILEVADEVGATLIGVGSNGMHGARRLTLGNVPNKVSRPRTATS